MADKFTTLEVDLSKVNDWNVNYGDDMVILNDYEVRVGRNRDPHTVLESFQDLTKTQGVNLRLLVGDKKVDINIPTEMKKRLVEYLSSDK